VPKRATIIFLKKGKEKPIIIAMLLLLPFPMNGLFRFDSSQHLDIAEFICGSLP